MRQVVGDHSVDEVITIGREEIALEAKEELQRLCDLYGIGIEVQQLVLQDVNPPDPVRPAFNEVNQAIQEKERAINEAWAEYNQAVPARQGRGRAGGAGGRGLRPRAREQRRSATPSASSRSTRSTARRRRSRASGIYLETMGALAAEARAEGDRGREGEGRAAAAPARRRRAKEVKP